VSGLNETTIAATRMVHEIKETTFSRRTIKKSSPLVMNNSGIQI